MSYHYSSKHNRYPGVLTAATIALVGACALTIVSRSNNDAPVECETATVEATTFDTIDALTRDVGGIQSGLAVSELSKLVRPQPTDTEIRVCSSGGNVSAEAITEGAIAYTVTNEGFATTETITPNK